jgi:hypothetical protein
MLYLKLFTLGLVSFGGMSFADMTCSYSNNLTYGSLTLVQEGLDQRITLKGDAFRDLNRFFPVELNSEKYVDGITFLLRQTPTLFTQVSLLSQTNEIVKTRSFFVSFNVRNQGINKLVDVKLGDDAGTIFSRALIFENKECRN